MFHCAWCDQATRPEQIPKRRRCKKEEGRGEGGGWLLLLMMHEEPWLAREVCALCDVRTLSRLKCAGSQGLARCVESVARDLCGVRDPPKIHESWLEAYVFSQSIQGQKFGAIAPWILAIAPNGRVHISRFSEYGIEDVTHTAASLRALPRMTHVVTCPGAFNREATWWLRDVRGGLWRLHPLSDCVGVAHRVPWRDGGGSVRDIAWGYTDDMSLLLVDSARCAWAWRAAHHHGGGALDPRDATLLLPASFPTARVCATQDLVTLLLCDGRVLTGGTNTFLQLGNPDAQEGDVQGELLPIPIPIASPVCDVACARGALVTLHEDGAVCVGGWCSLTRANRLMPLNISTPMTHVAITDCHMVLLGNNGVAWTCGAWPDDHKMARPTDEAVICSLSPVLFEGIVEVAACNVHIPQALTLLRMRSNNAEAEEARWQAWGAHLNGEFVGI